MKKLSCIIVLAVIAILNISILYAATIPPIDVKNNNGSFALRASTYIDSRVLAANTAETATVPTDSITGLKANYVVFSSTCSFFTNFRGTATVPAADITDGSSSELNPTVRYLAGTITSISIIADSACTVTLMYFK